MLIMVTVIPIRLRYSWSRKNEMMVLNKYMVSIWCHEGIKKNENQVFSLVPLETFVFLQRNSLKNK